MVKSKFWCFTLNNPEVTDEDLLRNLKYDYLIFGREIGKSGTKHLQGYIEFSVRKEFTTVCKINPRIHWENRRGSSLQASDYCKKDGDFVEIGKLSTPQQGKRTDLDELKEAAMESNDLRGIVMECKNLQQIRFVEKIYEYKKDNGQRDIEVYWYHGYAGTGKTRAVAKKTDGLDVYWKNDSSKWWDGYCGEEIVVFDDLDIEEYGFRNLLRLMDRYPLRVQVKGGYRQFLCKKLYITCPYNPENYWYGNERAEITRRITKIKNFEDPRT